MTDGLRRAFRDITAGSTAAVIATRPCFIRHLCYADQIGIEDKREAFLQEAKAAGLPTNVEKLALLRTQGLWTDQMDLELAQAAEQVPALITAKKNLANMPSLVTHYVKLIAEAEKAYEDKELAKRRLLELTCEVYADRCVNDHYIIVNLFADQQMTRPLFTDEEFGWFRDEAVSAIVADYNAAMESCSPRNLKRLAMQPFFQRPFQLVGDDLSSLFGKPIALLTDYQIDLLRYGAHFRSIYAQHDVSTFPPEALNDPDLMTDHAMAVTKGKEEMQQKGVNETGTSVMGLKGQDSRALGVANSPRAMQEMVKFGR